jgi:sugar phosphate isomerase/epimerase
MTVTTRREFLQKSIAAGAALGGLGIGACQRVGAIEPLQRKGACCLRLSLAAYSFRDFFNQRDTARQLTLFNFINFCAEHGCHGAELTSYYFPKEVTQPFLIELKRQAFLRGLAISGTAVGNNFTRPASPERDREIAQVKKWVDYAFVMGAPHIRVFAGDGKGVEKAEAQKLCIQALEECCDYAGGKGIWLGLENHGGIVSQVSDLLDIVRAVKSPWCGVNLDTGNFYSDADPYDEMARLAPYAVNVQLKVEINRRGQGRQVTDLARVIKILREVNYQGYVALEYEANDPWKEVPVWLKRMRAAFVS